MKALILVPLCTDVHFFKYIFVKQDLLCFFFVFFVIRWIISTKIYSRLWWIKVTLIIQGREARENDNACVYIPKSWVTFRSLIREHVIRGTAAAVWGVAARRSSLESFSFQLVHLCVWAARSAKWSRAQSWELSPAQSLFSAIEKVFCCTLRTGSFRWITLINPDLERNIAFIAHYSQIVWHFFFWFSKWSLKHGQTLILVHW